MLNPPAAALVILQLADDFNVFALVSQDLPDGLHICGLADERGEHHVDTLFHAKLQILNVLLRHSRQVHGSPWKVHTLLAAQHAAILNLTLQVVTACGQVQMTVRSETEREAGPCEDNSGQDTAWAADRKCNLLSF